MTKAFTNSTDTVCESRLNPGFVRHSLWVFAWDNDEGSWSVAGKWMPEAHFVDSSHVCIFHEGVVSSLRPAWGRRANRPVKTTMISSKTQERSRLFHLKRILFRQSRLLEAATPLLQHWPEVQSNGREWMFGLDKFCWPSRWVKSTNIELKSPDSRALGKNWFAGLG